MYFHTVGIKKKKISNNNLENMLKEDVLHYVEVAFINLTGLKRPLFESGRRSFGVPLSISIR